MCFALQRIWLEEVSQIFFTKVLFEEILRKKMLPEKGIQLCLFL